MPGYYHGPFTMPVISGPTQPPSHGHFFDAFDFGHHGDGHGLPATHPDLSTVSHPDLVHTGEYQTAVHQFIESHANIVSHLGVDFGGGLLAHNLPFWGHGDWAA
jgi:hypothetical protein